MKDEAAWENWEESREQFKVDFLQRLPSLGGTSSGATQTRVWNLLHHYLEMWLWNTYLTSLRLSFDIYTSNVVVKLSKINEYSRSNKYLAQSRYWIKVHLPFWWTVCISWWPWPRPLHCLTLLVAPLPPRPAMQLSVKTDLCPVILGPCKSSILDKSSHYTSSRAGDNLILLQGSW